MAKEKENLTLPDFQSELNAFLQKLVLGVQQLTTLEIQTVVCDLSLDFDSTSKKLTIRPADNPPKVDGIVSRIRLVEGDIDCLMSSGFAEGNYKSLREYHQLKESQAQDIVRKNMEVIKTVVTSLSHKFGADEH